MAAFWLIQAITGALIVFHWEVEDRTIAGPHRATDLAAIDRRIATLAPPGSHRRVISVWTTAGAADRYDITLTDEAMDTRRAVRIAGDGGVLRDKNKSSRSGMDVLVSVHKTLLGGTIGEWIVGVSGLALLSNLVLGLIVAWPKRGRWRRSITPTRSGTSIFRLYGWHRAVGLWAVVPAIGLVAAGTMLRFEDGVSALFGVHGAASPSPIVTGRTPVPFSTAVGAALNAMPGSRLTAVTMPTNTDQSYRIRLLAPGEIRRAYGTSVVIVDGATGTVRSLERAQDASAGKAFIDGLYAVHTGEIGGLGGRIAVVALGIWLASMVCIGVLLWNRRRPRVRP